jgi:hypothetical protein
MWTSTCRRAGAAAVAAALVLCTPVGAATNETDQSAVWTPKELRFIYQGFTSTYSCEGLRDKVREILLQLGARKDLKVSETPCSGLAGRPTPFPGVTIKMNVLQPAAGKDDSQDSEVIPAHWKTVRLRPDRSALDEAGDCELVEQVKQTLLPLFATRNIEFSSNCVPHQLQLGGTRLRADVLVTDQKDKAKGTPLAK